MQRKKNRTPEEVKSDVDSTNKLVREDVYDVLKSFPNRKRAVEGLEEWLRSLDRKVLAYQGDIEEGIKRVLDDINSYGVIWDE